MTREHILTSKLHAHDQVTVQSPRQVLDADMDSRVTLWDDVDVGASLPLQNQEEEKLKQSLLRDRKKKLLQSKDGRTGQGKGASHHVRFMLETLEIRDTDQFHWSFRGL
ncbi:hypothetical protein R1flu_014179 [Riccia fluitans]|uniref:Uncharacterized protein n=1 Tax=Riccia fluitans TaxID=41844 RepID=A0ABD1YFD2_9MARC